MFYSPFLGCYLTILARGLIFADGCRLLYFLLLTGPVLPTSFSTRLSFALILLSETYYKTLGIFEKI
jgi:hypothetical protein